MMSVKGPLPASVTRASCERHAQIHGNLEELNVETFTALAIFELPPHLT